MIPSNGELTNFAVNPRSWAIALPRSTSMPWTVVPSVPINSFGAYEASAAMVMVPSALIDAGTSEASEAAVLVAEGVAAERAALLDEEELPQALRSRAPARTTPVPAEIRRQPPGARLSLFTLFKDFLHLIEVGFANSESYPQNSLVPLFPNDLQHFEIDRDKTEKLHRKARPCSQCLRGRKWSASDAAVCVVHGNPLL
ncbi:hypothetical protein GALL_369940 [mine drainage metagenome]|uniref:Uncharacterized protein n=1 Tax=mine drainage metagenome TaxID=410659 RepID=A0A1J5QC64_9ZZZZ